MDKYSVLKEALTHIFEGMKAVVANFLDEKEFFYRRLLFNAINIGEAVERMLPLI